MSNLSGRPRFPPRPEGRGFQRAHLMMQAEIDELRAALTEANQSLDLIHDADMRGIAMWHADSPTERELLQPDRSQMIFWLLKRIDDTLAALATKNLPLGTCDECGTEYVFDATDGGSVCVPCLYAKLATARKDERERCAYLIEQKGKEYVEKWGDTETGNSMDEKAKVYAWDCMQHAIEIRNLSDEG